MTRRFIGAVASCLVLFTGLWLVLAPFALGFQPKGKDWTDQTFTNVWSGIGLAVVGLIATVAFVAALIRHLAERGLISPRPARRPAPAQQADAVPAQEQAAPAASGDLDKLLAPLVAALAHDLERDRDRENGVDLAHVNHNATAAETPSTNGEAHAPADQHKEMPR